MVERHDDHDGTAQKIDRANSFEIRHISTNIIDVAVSGGGWLRYVWYIRWQKYISDQYN